MLVISYSGYASVGGYSKSFLNTGKANGICHRALPYVRDGAVHNLWDKGYQGESALLSNKISKKENYLKKLGNIVISFSFQHLLTLALNLIVELL